MVHNADVVYDFGRQQVLHQPRRVYLGGASSADDQQSSQLTSVRPKTPETRPCTDEIVSELLSSLADLLRSDSDDTATDQANQPALSSGREETSSEIADKCTLDSAENTKTDKEPEAGRALPMNALKVLGVLTAGAAIGTGAGALAGSMLVGSGVAIAAATGSSTALWFRRLRSRSAGAGASEVVQIKDSVPDC